MCNCKNFEHRPVESHEIFKTSCDNCVNFKKKEESAFRRLFKNKTGYDYIETDGALGKIRKAYKSTWNAAIDAVLNKCLPGDFEDPEMAYRDTIKKLKEK